jgi:hypothetical protein
MLGVLQLVSLGLMGGELLARVYHENCESPPYAIREKLDRDDDHDYAWGRSESGLLC